VESRGQKEDLHAILAKQQTKEIYGKENFLQICREGIEYLKLRDKKDKI
jgi:hypothetical protein